MNRLTNKVLAFALAFASFVGIFFTSPSFAFGQGGGYVENLTNDIVKTATVQQTKYQENTLQVTFLNVAMGDCTFIRYNDTQILIDSGEQEANSDQGVLNAQGIVNYVINNLGENDFVLDYVIVTHGDSDHLGVMDKVLSNFISTYKVGTIIDFDSLYYEAFYLAKNQPAEYEKHEEFFNTKANLNSPDINNQNNPIQESYHSDKLSAYKKQRDNLVKKHNTKYYCVAERLANDVEYTAIFENNQNASNINNANSEFRLGSDANAPILKILYNKNYFDLLNSDAMAKEIQSTYSDYAYYVNTKSVCSLIKYGETKVLLTGDLEESHGMKGESNLVNTYKEIDEDLLKNVTLYKAAHHGSNTSNTKELLRVIRPKYIAISALANSQGDRAGSYWNFPRQSVLNDFLSITDKIFITARYDSNSGVKYAYHGNITFIMDDKENVTVDCSNKDNSWEIYGTDGELLPIHETKWFKQNRTVDLKVFTFSGYKSPDVAYLGNCTLIKYLYYDILIDCGNDVNLSDRLSANSTFYLDKVKKEVLDGVLEYVIVTTPMYYSISQLIDKKNNITGEVISEGLSQFKVNVLICNDNYDPSNDLENSIYDLFQQEKKQLANNNAKIYNSYSPEISNKNLQICKNLSIKLLQIDNMWKFRLESGICSLITFYDKQLLLMSDLTTVGEQMLLKKYKGDFTNVVYFQPSYFGDNKSSSNPTRIKELKSIYKDDIDKIETENTLLQIIRNKKEDMVIVLNSINTAPNNKSNGEERLSRAVCNRLLNCSKDFYLTMYVNNQNKYSQICGDIVYTIQNSNGTLTPFIQGAVSTQPFMDTDFYQYIKRK